MQGDAGGTVATTRVDAAEAGPATAGTRARDVDSRRAEVVGRLLERGMSVRVLQALLPGWEHTIRIVTPDGADRPSQP